MSRPANAQRGIWLAGATAVVVAALVEIVIVVRGEPGENDARAVATLVAVLVCGGAAVASLQLFDRLGTLRVVGAITLVAAIAEFVALELGILKGFIDGDNDWIKLVPIGLAWAIATLLTAGTALLGRFELVHRISLGTVAISGASFALVASVLIWTENASEGWGKTVAVSAIAMVAAFLATPLLIRFERSREDARKPIAS